MNKNHVNTLLSKVKFENPFILWACSGIFNLIFVLVVEHKKQCILSDECEAMDVEYMDSEVLIDVSPSSS